MSSILVCGGGNAAQVATCLFGNRYKVSGLSLFADEGERWDKAVKDAGHMTLVFQDGLGKGKTITAVPDNLTNDPAVVADCDVVLFTVPSSFHGQYFSALKPHVKDGTVFAVMPARSGCDYLFADIFKERAEKLGLVSFETLPWACRFNEWGKSATVLGTKETIGASIKAPAGKTKMEVLLMLQGLLGIHPMIVDCPNTMSISLGNPGAVVHPGVTYGRYANWDGTVFKEKPLFYHGVDEFAETVLTGISDEIQGICKKLQEVKPGFDTSQVKTIMGWYMASYSESITDSSSLMKAMNTNSAYNGLCHPMKEADGGYMPDFTFRYLSEDVPTGLCFMKGVGELLGVDMPTIDKVLLWAQEKIGKEFLVDGKMCGKDIKETRAPQAYGVMDQSALLKSLDIEQGDLSKRRRTD